MKEHIKAGSELKFKMNSTEKNTVVENNWLLTHGEEI
jgi:hypothetical protein